MMPVNPTRHVVLVDDDPLFRESLGLNLADHGFNVTDFDDGAQALRYFAGGGTADAVLLDWRLPGIDGLAVLRRMRAIDVHVPVIFLTVLSDEDYEKEALRWGAVDFIDKSRSLGIILRRLRVITEGGRQAAPADEGSDLSQPLTRGRLELRTHISRAYYDGRRVDLTLTEFNIVRLLVGAADADVSYRQIYDLVRGKDFIAGDGEEGFRVNVRSFIKRVRQKFRDIDEGFDCIANYPGFGYRWLDTD